MSEHTVVELEYEDHNELTWRVEAVGNVRGEREPSPEGWIWQTEVSLIEMTWLDLDDVVPDNVFSALEIEAATALTDKWLSARKRSTFPDA